MISAYSPGHITCFFQPVRTNDPITTGSRGVGIRTEQGANVSLEERTDRRIVTVMDGEETDCVVTKLAISTVSDRGYDVIIKNDLPVGQGFGMSAAGAIAAALCACEFEEKECEEAYRSAHCAEVLGGGGLGDLSALMYPCEVPIRSEAGYPLEYGRIMDSGVTMGKFTVAVLGCPLNTGSTLADPAVSAKIQTMGYSSVEAFISSPSKKKLFRLSEEFSSSIGLETVELEEALWKLRRHGNAGMCMLGHSIFTDLPEENVRELLGDGVTVIACSATEEMPHLTHIE